MNHHSEALGLRWEDVDLEQSRLSIRQNMTTDGYKVVIGTPKTGRGRSLDLDPATVDALRSFRKQQLEEKVLWRQAGYVDSGFVFRQENGQPYHPNRITKLFEAAVKASGQPRIRLHDLRHTYATLALGEGVNAKYVSERLGHASITITLDIYSYAIPARSAEAAAKVAATFVPV
jgi:integrase